MRDLLFKNLTSEDRRRRVIATSETSDREGVRTTINRHFVSIVREVTGQNQERPLSHIYVTRERNTREQRERFFCKIKGHMYVAKGKRLFLVLFMHSLNINLTAVPQASFQHGETD